MMNMKKVTELDEIKHFTSVETALSTTDNSNRVSA